MTAHHKINYIEFPVKDVAASKRFFSEVFDWQFTDYGPDYCAINNASIDAGFFKAESTMNSEQGSALIVLYSDDLQVTQVAIENAGGKIVKPTFSFPGGQRFHFHDTNGNEFAVWTKQS